MVQNGEKEGWKWCKTGQGGAAVVQNGARRVCDGAEWCKEGWKQCKMGQGEVEMVQNGARRGSSGAKCSKEGW